MSTHLITGYAGREHITSADQGSFNAAIMGNGEFVLERGEQFRCQVISNNKVRIFDGDALMQGRHIIIDRNTYEETTHDNGTQGYKRIDLIVLTYEKNPTTGVETVTLDVIKGTPDSINPSVPEYVTGDIVDSGDLKNQMPLYKVPFDGLSIGTPVKMFSTVETLESMESSVKEELEGKFEELEESVDEKIADAGKPLVSDLEEMKMLQNYGEYSADAKTVGDLYGNLGNLRFGIDADGNYGYYKVGADSVTPFKSVNPHFTGANGSITTIPAIVGHTYIIFMFSLTKDGATISGCDILAETEILATKRETYTANAKAIFAKATSNTITSYINRSGFNGIIWIDIDE